MICINTWLHKGSQTELVGLFLLSCRHPGTLVSHRINGQKRLVHTSCLSHSHVFQGVETLKPPMINMPIRFYEMSIYSGHDCLINHEAKHFRGNRQPPTVCLKGWHPSWAVRNSGWWVVVGVILLGITVSCIHIYISLHIIYIYIYIYHYIYPPFIIIHIPLIYIDHD